MSDSGIQTERQSAGRERWLPVITAVFVTSLIVSNIIAVKLFSIGPVILPAGVIVFPISYIFGDILTEVYGYARARQVIWIGFGCNLIAVAAIMVSIYLPPASFWDIAQLGSGTLTQRAYAAILGFAPRVLMASFVAYLAGEFLNSFVMAKMKIATQGRHLWSRTFGSTLVGQLADSGIFISLAFFGTVPTAALLTLIASQWLVKSAYEALVTPLTYAIVNFLKRAENRDYYDYNTNFNPLIWGGEARETGGRP
ncbi:MAG: queuosine precursor transporter [Bacteroidetes bacterium]|nr:queuosine precursor transporter [Bacteroidota bacterium]MCL5267381.1 queuosine precursor transporter [Bacteroidota bacterium]